MLKLRNLSVLVLSTAIGTGYAEVAQGLSIAEVVGISDTKDLANQVVEEVKVLGLKKVGMSNVKNQIRVTAGNKYDPALVASDIKRLTALAFFDKIKLVIEKGKQGGVVVIYVVNEVDDLDLVAFVGNKAETDGFLAGLIVLKVGDPIDMFLVEEGVKKIETAYRNLGFHAAEVTYDKEELKKNRALVYSIREGQIAKISSIAFKGNQRVKTGELSGQIKSRKNFLFFVPGVLSREMLEADVNSIRKYYLDRGYMDVRVDRDIRLSDDSTQAAVTFLIKEGEQFVVDGIEFHGVHKFSEAQIREVMDLRVGDVYSEMMNERSTKSIEKMYGKLGYMETVIQVRKKFDLKHPRVVLVVNLTEGKPYKVGKITVRGNHTTRSHVIFRQIRGMEPGRTFDRSGVELTKRRLAESQLFENARVTVLGDKQDDVRDVLIEVEEGTTGNVGFGVAIGSDAGIFGGINVVQKNFDITDFPESFGELMSGKAFKGGGQHFTLNLQPGKDYSRFSVGFREPYLLGNDVVFGTDLSYQTRLREEWDEVRTLGQLSFGRRFGDVWSVNTTLRTEKVDIKDLTGAVPADVRRLHDAGLEDLTSVGVSINRNTTNSRVYPTKGSNITLGLTETGALGGDFHFTTLTGKYRKYWTVGEDFLGRESVFRFRGDINYILPYGDYGTNAPFYERFYAGGHTTIRGFEFRGVGPRQGSGSSNGSPVGNDFMMLAGIEYEFPVYSEIVRWVVFADTGTVDSTPTYHSMRASVGTGIRLQIPFLGAPFALDYAIPMLKEDNDDTKSISFSLALPF